MTRSSGEIRTLAPATASALALAGALLTACPPAFSPIAASSAAGRTCGGTKEGPLHCDGFGAADPTFAPGQRDLAPATGSVAVEGVVMGRAGAPVAGAVLTFEDFQQRFDIVRNPYGGGAALVSVRSSADGRYRTADVFPPGDGVLVKALLLGDRRLEAIGRAGPAMVYVTAGSSYVTEYVRSMLPGPLSDVATAQIDAVIALQASADAAILAGKLSDVTDDATGDLTLGNGFSLARRYQDQVVMTDPATLRAWTAILGRSPVPTPTPATTPTATASAQP